MGIPRVLARGLHLLEVIAAGGTQGMALADAADVAGLAYATAARLAAALEVAGWLERRQGRWRIGPTALLAVHGGSSAARFRERVLPVLVALARRTGASATASVLHRGQRLLVAFAPAPGTDQHLPMGLRNEIWATASGRLLLARAGARAIARHLEDQGPPGRAWPQVVDRQEVLTELTRLRRQGWATVRTDTWGGMALAIDDGDGNAAVMAMHVPVGDFTRAAEARFLAALRAAARDFARR
jgi:DNA-binding IclR family transcriptional regulator